MAKRFAQSCPVHRGARRAIDLGGRHALPDDGKLWWQAVALTRFFVESRSKKTRQLLTDYMGNVHQVLAELEAKDGKDKEKAPPKNEEEEERQFKARQEWLKSRERAILDQTLARTFPGWSAADWKNLDREFRRSM